MKLAILITASAMLSSGASGDLVTIQGQGLRPCSEWVVSHQKMDVASMVQDGWLGGFVSGFNTYGSETYGNADADVAVGNPFSGMVGWITWYCAAHPKDTIVDAAMAMIIDFEAKKAK